METKLPEFLADGLHWRHIKFQPNPFANNLGLLEHLRHFTPQPV
jgi:hypothetical protein